MKILAVGEVMMRLTPPNYKLIEQTDTLDLSFSGTGLNILSGLSRNGIQTSLLTNLPDNSVGKAAGAFIRKLGVKDEWLNYSGQHIGTYFLELGFGNRPSNVTYLNRSTSSFCQNELPNKLVEEAVLAHDMIHICGIALSTSKVSRKLILEVVETAHLNQKKIVFDFNFRPSLNEEIDYQQLLEDYRFILSHAHFVFGNARDLINLYPQEKLSEKELLQLFFNEFKQIEWLSGTSRKEDNLLSGFVYLPNEKIESDLKELATYDRIGTGDAYAAGVLLGYMKEWPLQETVNFAIAAAELAHTTFGDSPLLDEHFIRKYMSQPKTSVFR